MKKRHRMAVRMAAALCVIISMVCFSAAGCGKKQENLQELLDLGQKYLLEENYEEAAVCFAKVIETDPKNVEAYLGIVEAYSASGDRDKAYEYLNQGYEMTSDERLRERMEEYGAEEGASGTGIKDREEDADQENGEGMEDRDGRAGGPVPVLTEEETALVSGLVKLMESGDYKAAGEYFLENEAMLIALMEGAMKKGAFLFDGEKLKASLDGYGLALRPGRKVFMGNFKGGAPEGTCFGIQLADNGYCYYVNCNWSGGQEAGQGTCGYYALTGSGGGGDVVDDRATGVLGAGGGFSGEMTDRWVLGSGEVFTWQFQVRGGTVVRDSHFKPDEEGELYTEAIDGEPDRRLYVGEDEFWGNQCRWE